MSTFIKTGNKIIHQDAIRLADYTPEHPAGVDEETGESYNAKPSRLVLTLDTVEAKEFSDYDGGNQREATVSETLKFRGEAADRVWEWLSDQSYHL